MITEDYVSFEVAKLLKEKGFEGDINAYYHIWDNGNKVCSVQEFSHSEAPHLYIPAPTHQMAMKWLREEKNIIINMWYNGVDWDAEHYNNEDENFYLITNYSCNSYEEAVEAALKYSLENLI